MEVLATSTSVYQSQWLQRKNSKSSCLTANWTTKNSGQQKKTRIWELKVFNENDEVGQAITHSVQKHWNQVIVLKLKVTLLLILYWKKYQKSDFQSLLS